MLVLTWIIIELILVFFSIFSARVANLIVAPLPLGPSAGDAPRSGRIGRHLICHQPIDVCPMSDA